jgi:hypothetical protein
MIIEDIIYLNGAYSWKGNGLFVFRLAIEGLRYVYPPEVELYRRWALCAMREVGSN